MTINQLSSAIYNAVFDGLRGYHSTPTISIEQLEDEVLEERAAVMKEWQMKGIFDRKLNMIALNCIDVDCKDKSRCCKANYGKTTPHFEIPVLAMELGNDAIEFIGSVDREVQFVFYTDTTYQYHKYRKRNANKPYVYVETTLNENGMFDAWIFNAPFIKTISVIGIFRDPRQLEGYNCCNENTYLNIDSMAAAIKERLVRKYLLYYRQLKTPQLPNTQTPD